MFQYLFPPIKGFKGICPKKWLEKSVNCTCYFLDKKGFWKSEKWWPTV